MQHFILQTSTLHVKSIILVGALIAAFLGFLVADSAVLTLTFFIFHVFTLGVSHGAVDRWLFNLSNPTKQINTPQFLIGYLLVMGVVALFWIVFPSIALLLFLGYSAWHFGEAEWKDIITNSKFNRFIFTLWGLLLFVTMFLWNAPETNEVISVFIENEQQIIPDSPFYAFIVAGMWLISTVAGLIIGGIKSARTTVLQIANVVLLCVVFATTNLAISFALFFFYFHSVLSFYHELKLVLNAKPKNLKLFWLEIGVFTLIPCLGLLTFALFGTDLITQEVIMVLVILGSAISFPHTVLFSRALNNK